MNLTENSVIEKGKLTEIELLDIWRNIASIEKLNKKDIIKNQKLRFASWCLVTFATRFHMVVLCLHFVDINAFIQLSFSYLYIQGHYNFFYSSV